MFVPSSSILPLLSSLSLPSCRDCYKDSDNDSGGSRSLSPRMVSRTVVAPKPSRSRWRQTMARRWLEPSADGVEERALEPSLAWRRERSGDRRPTSVANGVEIAARWRRLETLPSRMGRDGDAVAPSLSCEMASGWWLRTSVVNSVQGGVARSLASDGCGGAPNPPARMVSREAAAAPEPSLADGVEETKVAILAASRALRQMASRAAAMAAAQPPSRMGSRTAIAVAPEPSLADGVEDGGSRTSCRE